MDAGKAGRGSRAGLFPVVSGGIKGGRLNTLDIPTTDRNLKIKYLKSSIHHAVAPSSLKKAKHFPYL
ncbi:hypothetical protein ADIS_3900 [Lunatimonas lonarensis]|uniref:Uncharacterized protein n=1 Tax=Lunatimonas lonarensis TaxID=1232681 RepID=R7ZN42_9BACT|nr:hypothetical protein ADIS_3900 [Lunatimonas lonarensis]